MTDTFDDDAASADDPRDLTAPYALDAVDDADRLEVERLLSDDAALRGEVDSFRAVVAAFTVDEAPPASIKNAVLADIEARRADSAAKPAPQRFTNASLTASPPPKPTENRASNHRTRWAISAIAAAAVVGIAIPTVIAVQARTEQQQMASEAAMVADMLADPNAQIVTAPMEGGGQLRALAASGNVMISATGMGALDDSKDYQLWLIQGDDVSSAGIIHPTDGAASMMLPDAEGKTLAVTVEPSGGSSKPTTTPVVTVKT